MLTNVMNLPESIVQAVTNDPYTRGGSDISVTQLIQPPYQRRLKQVTEEIEDVSARIWSLIGQSVHTILERAYAGKLSKVAIPTESLWKVKDAMKNAGCQPDMIAATLELLFPGHTLSAKEFIEKFGWCAERRLYTAVRGWNVSGQFDVIENGVLQDFKVTSVWSVKADAKIEWEQQLNLLRLLAHENGIEVNGLRIIALLRDWSKGKSKTAEYPRVQVVPIDIPVWPIERARKYMDDRVLAHQNETPYPCTDAERWQSESVYAVMKKGRQSAVRLHETFDGASQHASQLGVNHSVVHRPGGYRRCADYCSVAHACPQFKSEHPF